MARDSNSQRLDDPYPRPTGPHLVVANGEAAEEPPIKTGVTFEDGAIKVEQPDGSIVINFDGKDEESESDDENLADGMADDELESLASDLLEGILRDDESRREWLETRALGISLLGLKLERPRSDAGSSQAPLEGMSTLRHPLLLEATVSFQATARGELLPASGPVKVRNDSPVAPAAQMQTSAAQDLDVHLHDQAGTDLTPCGPGVPCEEGTNGQSADANEHYEFTAPAACSSNCTYHVVIHGYGDAANAYDIRIVVQ